ncbi:MAG: porin [Bdellovibrionaceae bacterium]|nr:porin [Pseudobdellovibrionaceae bacterium]
MKTTVPTKNKIYFGSKVIVVGVSALLISASLISMDALAETERKVTWGGFVDTQYSYDFNSPPNGDRVFTTQPARSNEFNINLGFVEAKLDSSKIRARFALQAGTSVQSNYSSEPRRGSVSGGDLSRHIQEARIGYAVSERTWVDAGIFFAHVGAESWISRDNLTLTRSLTAEYSPYYLSGAKITHVWSDRLSTLLLVTNGWQNISENNTDKNLGTGIEYSFDQITLAYNAMFGNEVSPDLNGVARKGEFRHFHNFILKNRSPDRIEWIAQADFGFQRKPDSSSYSSWWGTALAARYKLNEAQKVSLRLEHYEDLDQVIIVTGQGAPFNGTGGSIGFDQVLEEGLLWRNEVRYLAAAENLFPKDGGSTAKDDTTVTTSLALSF